MSQTIPQNLSVQYQQKSEKEHILHAPDTYIGSVERSWVEMDVFHEDSQRILPKTMEYVPALYKLFDEGVVNARDHVIRMTSSTAENKRLVSYIDITVDQQTGLITIENDGNGIDVEKHPVSGIWIPEMIFGHLRTSTNYNKEEKKIVGGKNGFGFKLVLIWSKYGRVETIDHTRQLHYTQEFHDNLNRIDAPTIKKVAKSAKPITRVSFIPDYARLGIAGLTDDFMALLKKRATDMAAVSESKIRVSFNGTAIPIKNFQQYTQLYIPPTQQVDTENDDDEGDGDETETDPSVSGAGDKTKVKKQAVVWETPHPRWEYAILLSPTNEFKQVSFVNGIATFKGGRHVDYIMGQITRQVCEAIEKKHKVKVAPQTIREQLFLFLRCDIENPSFESQSKDFLSTPSNKFGSTCEVSPAFIKKVLALGVAKTACSIHEIRENSKTARKANGAKTKTIRGIEKLDDAIQAGGSRSADCILILCEGDSAKSGIISGLTKEDRNTIGIYPLKGKLMNVRDQSQKRISENKEIADIIKILGLEMGKTYTADEMRRTLRYGKVMLCTDQDRDGSHIKGLCMNLFQSHWRSLFEITGFLSFMNTPILRATHSRRTTDVRVFYTDGEFREWIQQQTPVEQAEWKLKYFKGLGTSTAKEFKEYMSNKKIIDYAFTGSKSTEMMDIMFNKARSDDRKHLLLKEYNPASYLDKNQPQIPYETFVRDELLHFSSYDCERSIPHLMDGLKTSFRKILFCCLKRRLTAEIKVAQLSGYVSEHAEYHHGEQSLNGAIVNMAQNFVGSNNINLLEPKGQFGSRLLGGEDSASERYIFTQLSPLTRLLFPVADDPVLNYLQEDGHSIEPDFYAPILPFVLINGIMGIGTGFSCNIPAFSPRDLVQALQVRLSGQGTREQGSPTETQCWTPYYEGFKGTVEPIHQPTVGEGSPRGPTKFLIKGRYEKVGTDKIRITELPVGTWTSPYKTLLETLSDPAQVDKAGKRIPPIVKDIVSHSTDTVVDMTVELFPGKLAEWEAQRGPHGINGVEQHLRLSTTISTTNMHLFDTQGKLRKFANIDDILEAYYPERLAIYGKRKEHVLAELEAQHVLLSGRSRFIEEVLADTVDLRRKTSAQVEDLLQKRKYVRIDGDYKYLTKMTMDAVTQDNRDHLLKQLATNREEIRALKAQTLEDLWRNDLAIFLREYERVVAERTKEQQGVSSGAVAVVKKKTVAKKTAK